MTGNRLPMPQGTLDPSQFNQLLNGPATYRVQHRRAHLCPNKGERGGHVQGCPVCDGIGYYWDAPISAQQSTYEMTRAGHYPENERLPGGPAIITAIQDEDGVSYPPENVTVGEDGRVTWNEGAATPADYRLYNVTYETAHLRALIQGVTTQREFATRGEYEVQDLQITVDHFLADNATPNPAWDAGEHDRFLLLDTWRRYTQHLQRGIQDTAVYRRLRDVTLTGVVGGALVTWEPDTDYEVVDGAVVWQAGRGPRAQAYYTLSAQASPEYYVFQVLPQTRHMDGRPQPRRFVLRGFEKHPNVRPQT